MKTNIEIDQMKKHFFTNKKKGENEKSDKILSQIRVYDFFSINEIQICEIIEEKIPYYYNYFDIIHDYDFAKFGQLSENSIEKMDINTKEKYLIFEFKKRNLVKFNDFLFQFNKPKHIILQTITSFSYLLNSLLQLNNQKVCFFDLSIENIMFDLDCGEKPILLYFRNSLQMEKINEEYISKIIGKSKSNISYTCKPLEVHVLFYLIQNNLDTLSHSLIEEIVEIYIKNLCVLQLFSQNFIVDFKLSCILVLEKYINKSKKYIIQDIIGTIQTWDSYSLSIVYLHIFGNISRVFALKETFIGKLTILLTKNIHPDSSKRESLEKTCETYENLFYQFKDWSFVTQMPMDKMTILFDVLNA